MSKRKKIIIIIAAVIALIVVIQIVNASKYKMQVVVVEGQDIMGINPTTEKLDFGDLARNNGMTRYITLKSGGGASTYIIVWKFGGIAELIKVNNNFFTLNSGEETKLEFNIRIPNSAEIKKYSGGVWIFRLPRL